MNDDKALLNYISNYQTFSEKVRAVSEHQVWGNYLFSLFLWSGPSYQEAQRSRKHFVVSGNGLPDLFERHKDRYRDFDFKLFIAGN